MVWLVVGIVLVLMGLYCWYLQHEFENISKYTTRTCERLFDELAESRNKVKELRNKLTDQDSEISDLRAEIKAMEDQIEAYEASQDGCDTMLANLTCELRKRENVLKGIGRLMDGLK